MLSKQSFQPNLLIAALHASVCQQITFLAGLHQDMLLRIRLYGVWPHKLAINSPSRYKTSWFFNVHIYSVKSAQSLLKCGDFWYPVLMFEDLRFPKSGQQPHEAQIIHHVFYNFFRTVYYFFMGSDPSTRQWFICFIFCIESRCTLNNAIVFIFEVSSYRGNTLNTPFCARILSLW